MATVRMRETSFEGLASQFLEEIPFLKQVCEAIEFWKEQLKTASGRDAYIIKNAIIELGKDKYIIKNAYRKPTVTMSACHSIYWVPLNETEEIIDGEVKYTGVSLMDYKVCSAILCYYSKLKAAAEGNFISDTWYLMETFDDVSGRALAPYPLYERLVELKIDGKQNVEIQNILQTEFGIKHSVEYISSLWRNKIPKLIASQAEDDFLDWWYLTKEKGKYKKCGRCGQIKLAHNKYFSKNKTSPDGFYSICKECRNTKKKKGEK